MIMKLTDEQKLERKKKREEIKKLRLDFLLEKTYCTWVAEYRFCERKWMFDFALPRLYIAIEIEGGVWTKGRHTTPSGFIGDMEKYNRATSLGWKVLRFLPEGKNDMCLSSEMSINTIRETIDEAYN